MIQFWGDSKFRLSHTFVKVTFFFKKIQWGWGITGQSISDWLKKTSPRTPNPKLGVNYSGDLNRYLALIRVWLITVLCNFFKF